MHYKHQYLHDWIRLFILFRVFCKFSCFVSSLNRASSIAHSSLHQTGLKLNTKEENPWNFGWPVNHFCRAYRMETLHRTQVTIFIYTIVMDIQCIYSYCLMYIKRIYSYYVMYIQRIYSYYVMYIQYIYSLYSTYTADIQRIYSTYTAHIYSPYIADIQYIYSWYTAIM